MTHPRQADLGALIEALAAAGAEFIVVGGAAAVLHGAPTTTLDLDLVYRRTPENLTRLERVLGTLDAVARNPADRHLRPTRSHLDAGRQLQLSTSLGPLDPMGRLLDDRGYDELLPHSELVVDGDLAIRVLDLPTLIEVKGAAGRAKDRLVLPLLLALLEERNR